MATNKKQWHLYVLKLEKDKYYVGITSHTVEKRFNEHLNKVRAANWTMKYRPVEVIHSRELGIITKEDAEYIENKTVRDYIYKYGINNVRGGDIKTTIDLFIFRRTLYDRQYVLDIVQSMALGALITLSIITIINHL